MIVFLELSVGAMIRPALYKPLAGRDPLKISEVIAFGSSFFRKLSGILVLYAAALVVAFPFFVDNTFEFAFDATLILAMSISHFARYYFGLIDGLLLNMDQKAYILDDYIQRANARGLLNWLQFYQKMYLACVWISMK